MKEYDGRSDKIALYESHWRYIDDIKTRVRTKKNGALVIFQGLHDS